MRQRLVRLAVLGAAALALAGCSYASPDTSEVGLSYTGGWESKEFNFCVQPGGYQKEDVSGVTYYYPAGQRTYDFSNRPGHDAGPITVTTKDQLQVAVSGTVTFALNTDCAEYTEPGGKVWKGGMLQKFHDTIGRQKGAFFTDDASVVPAGWVDTMILYLGSPLERVMDQQALNYTAFELTADASKRNEWLAAVLAAAPGLVDQQAGDKFFAVHNVQVDKPDLPATLQDQLTQRQAAEQAAETGRITQNAQQDCPGCLDAQIAQDQKRAEIDKQRAEAECLRSGRCALVPGNSQVLVPAGS